MLVQVDSDIWTLDGPELVFAGAPMHTRMTIVRLQDRRLWIHSPIELSTEVRALVDELGGDIAAVVAPNKFHYLFVHEWREAFPDARLFVEADLAGKVVELANEEILTNTTPSLYAQDVDQVILDGNRMFQEAVFFHKASRTAIFTDVFINLRTDGMPTIPRWFLRFEGVAYPNGGVPRLFRWFSNKHKSREAIGVIREWRPSRVLFCHGEPFEVSAAELFAREFAYLD